MQILNHLNMSNDNVIVSVDQLLPDDLFIIPVKFRPVFPGMVTPLVISPGSLAESTENISEKSTFVGLILQKNEKENDSRPENLYNVGTAVKILKKINLPEGGIHLLVNTIKRFRVKEYVYTRPNLVAKVGYHDEIKSEDKEITALTRAIISQAKELMNQSSIFTEEMKLTLVNVEEPGKIADFVCSVLNLDKEEFQQILETFELKPRLEKTLQFLSREMELLRLQQKIQGRVNDKLEQQQKEYFLKEQLQAIRSELESGKGSKDKGSEHYREKIEATELSEEAREKALAEVEKLEYVDTHSNEYSVIRNYLDTILELPWEEPGFADPDLARARRILQKDHYGLEEVKERIIEHLAVRKLLQSEKGNILCFVGPPGVGKTSLGQSIARALDRPFYRFSLGGMRDEAEIKGHRRTYVGAMPGKIIQALKVVKSSSPVLMLDEIDKLGISYQGDPASALLEVLDPEQNSSFRDHFLDVPFNLSNVSFITTANTLDSIPGPLLDRMEVIRLSGYILEEKVKIAQKYIIPRAISEMGLTRKNAAKLTVKGLKELIDGYSREAGVRSLEKNIKKIYRKNATAIVEKRGFDEKIEEDSLKKLLGPKVFRKHEDTRTDFAGVAVGLAWTSMGGATLLIETSSVPGKGKLRLTGSLGKVMNESAEIALTYVKSLLGDAGYWNRHDIHIHVPDGATPKDGPSAGITITTALLSLHRNRPIKKGFAMTGEIRLTGQVLPIGGLKEKVIAARRVGIKKIIFPADNRRDWDELPDILKKGIKIHPVENYSEIEELLF